MSKRSVGVLHPGEMGAAVAATIRNTGHEVYWASSGRGAETCRRAEAAGLNDAGTLVELCRRCDVIVSVCPPEFATELAQQVGAHGFHGLYLDLNAISPRRAQEIGHSLEPLGIRFVDGGIIGVAATERGKTWIYLSGESAPEAAACFGEGPLEVEVLAGEVGKASALKMVFAANSKGTAALRAAVLGAAQELGVLPDLERQWERSRMPMAQVTQSLQQVAPKAWRFAPEMREICETFEAAGMPDGFHRAAEEIFERLAVFRGSREVAFEQVLQRLVIPATKEN